VVSERLNEKEQRFVAAVSRKLDGVPYVEKGRIIEQSLETFRRGGSCPEGSSGQIRLAGRGRRRKTDASRLDPASAETNVVKLAPRGAG
jgi:hypothetical protein